jgi:hypothetical protein
MDLGNTRNLAAAGVVANHTYFLMARQDPNGTANFGWGTGAKSRLSLFDADALTWKHFDFTNNRSTLTLQAMNIGRFSGSREWNGTIDDVRVFNETLSQDQANAMVVNPAVFTLLAPAGTPTGDTTADLSDYSNMASDDMKVYWGTNDEGQTAVGWTGTTVELGAQSAGTVSTNLTGLTPNTRYFVRFFASISSPPQEVWSPAGSFITGLSTSVAGPTLAAGTITGVEVPLSWDDTFLAETGYVLERADDNAFTVNVATFTIGANGTSYTDRSGASDTTYYYRVAAKDAVGQTAYSNTMTVDTLTVATPVPVLHWKLDDAGTTFTEEITGNTTNSVAVNTVTTGLPALAPGGGASIALTIDTPGSYIDAGTVQADGTYAAGLGDGTYKLINTSWTITGWANIANTGLGDQIIISSDFNANDGWMLGTTGDDLFFDYGNTRLAFNTNGLADATTYLFVARRDATKTVFGGNVNTAAISIWDGTTWTQLQGNQNKNIRLQGLEIGSFATGTRQLGGNIDDVRIYDRALTQAELEALVPASPPSGYADWAAINAPGQDPDEDYDNDGVANGVEYFMGISGADPVFTSNPGLVGDSVTWPIDPAFSGTFAVQTSPDLGTWTDRTTDPAYVTVIADSVVCTLPPGAGTLFVRLVVTPN